MKEISYLLLSPALEADKTKSILDNLEVLPSEPNIFESGKNEMIRLLDLSEGQRRSTEQKNLEHCRKGIETIFRIMQSNDVITSAPSEFQERKQFYLNLAKGFRLLTNTIHEEYEKGALDKKDVYACIETIGDGGHACAGRWKQVLEEMLLGFSDRLSAITVDKKNQTDPFFTSIQALFEQARLIEGNRAAEEFIALKFPRISEGNRIHFVTFFKRYLNLVKNYQLPISMEEDPYMKADLFTYANHAQDYLESIDLDHDVVKRFLILFQEKVKNNISLYNQLVDYASGIFCSNNMNSRYEDKTEFLSEYVFEGYSKTVKMKALQEILVRKGFISKQEINVNIKKKISNLVKRKRWEDLQTVLNMAKKDDDIKSIKQELDFHRVLIIAAWMGNEKLVNSLLRFDVNPNEKDNEGNTALIWATRQGHTQIVRRLIRGHADVNVNNKEGTALLLAVKSGHINMVKALLEAKADVNLKNIHSTPILNLAIKQGNFEIVKELIKAGADVNAKDFFSTTPLMQSIEQGRIDFIKILLQAKVDVSILNQNHENALMLALLYGNKDIVEQLIELGANVNTRNKKGETPLWYAIHRRNVEMVKTLITANADVNASNVLGKTLLQRAIEIYEVESALELIKSGVDINKQDDRGNTPLMNAIMKDFTKVSIKLIEAEADLHIKNQDGKTALSIAKLFRNHVVVDLIKEVQKKQLKMRLSEKNNSSKNKFLLCFGK